MFCGQTRPGPFVRWYSRIAHVHSKKETARSGSIHNTGWQSMGWGRGTAGRVSGARRLVIAWILLTSAQAVSAADSEAAHFTSAPRALYATASAPVVADGSDVDVLEAQDAYTFDADGNSR